MAGLQGFSVAGKSWVSLGGSLVAGSILPWFLANIAPNLEEPWPALIGAAVAVATAVGVYHAPYQPVPSRNSGPSSTTNPWPTA
jgi:hypothetical protein